MVVQIVRSGDDGGAFLHGHGARPSPRFRHAGRPGRRTLSTYTVAGATITTTPGPHRSDCRDRQLRQDGGMTIFRYQVLLLPYTGCSRSRASGFEDLSVISNAASLNSSDENIPRSAFVLDIIWNFLDQSLGNLYVPSCLRDFPVISREPSATLSFHESTGETRFPQLV